MKKLRILCLHGYNNNAAILKFQMRNFIETFGEFVEFGFLDGPFEVLNEKPISTFVEKGITPPYRCWANFSTQVAFRT